MSPEIRDELVFISYTAYNPSRLEYDIADSQYGDDPVWFCAGANNPSKTETACYKTSHRVFLLPWILLNLINDNFYAMKSNNMKLIRVRESIN
jgi:hypothetical protein